MRIALLIRLSRKVITHVISAPSLHFFLATPMCTNHPSVYFLKTMGALTPTKNQNLRNKGFV